MTRVSITLGACLALLLPAIGCSSSKSGTEAASPSTITTLPKPVSPLDPELDALNPNFFANRRPDSSWYIGFAAGAGGSSTSPKMSTLRDIRAVSAIVYGPRNERLDSLGTDNVTFSGTMRGDDEMSVTGTAGVTWRPSMPPVPGTFAIVTIHGANGVTSRRVEIVHDPSAGASNADQRPSVVLSLDLNERGPALEFVLKARRVAPAPDGEYLPSGERYRIEIRNELNETVWSSSSNKTFTQAIGPVEPVTIGREVEYRITWDGYSEIDHAPAPAGTYRIVATIPAQPKPYVLREELTRSGR